MRSYCSHVAAVDRWRRWRRGASIEAHWTAFCNLHSRLLENSQRGSRLARALRASLAAEHCVRQARRRLELLSRLSSSRGAGERRTADRHERMAARELTVNDRLRQRSEGATLRRLSEQQGSRTEPSNRCLALEMEPRGHELLTVGVAASDTREGLSGGEARVNVSHVKSTKEFRGGQSLHQQWKQ